MKKWIDHTPSEWVEGKLISVQKMGGYFNWRKFKSVPERFMLFTERGIYEYVENSTLNQEGKS